LSDVEFLVTGLQTADFYQVEMTVWCNDATKTRYKTKMSLTWHLAAA